MKRVLAVLLLCVLMLASCTQDVPKDEQSVSYTDALGRELAVPKNPSRTAALLGSFADVWTLAGGSLCAAAEDAWEDFSLSLNADTVNIGGAHSPSLELLLSSSPTLVLASASTASHLQMREALESLGITVIYFDVDDFSDYLSMLKLCCDLTGRDDLYRQNGELLAEGIREICEDYKSAQIPDDERRILLLRASSTGVKAKGSEGTVLGEMLRDIGCVNIADTDGSLLENLSVEQVIQNEPYHIFVVTMGDNTEAAMASLDRLMEENGAWASLRAVKEGRVHMMDKSLFNLKPNARYEEAYEILFKTLTEE